MELPMDKEHLNKAVQTFPLLGLLQGMIYSFLFYMLIQYTPFSQLAVAFLLWLITILLTGGIHLDGWMDASDAYFSYRDQEKRLEIMKDPRTGAFSVISIIILLSSRFLFIYEIALNIQLYSYILIAAIPFLSKSLMGTLLLTVKSAKKEGLGSFFQAAAKPGELWIYPVYIIVFLLIFIKMFLQLAIILLAAASCYLFYRRKVVKWFGGITGDVVGASVEGTELILWMTVWLLHYFVMV
jgi:adenosylcobinamide-GDP ribazoletransferase